MSRLKFEMMKIELLRQALSRVSRGEFILLLSTR